MSWRDEYLAMIETCFRRKERLSAWEVSFLNTIRSRLDLNGLLNYRQTEILEQIWARVK